MWVHALAGAVFLLASTPNMALLAQGLNSGEAIDTIIGSDVKTGEEQAAGDESRIISAIENTPANISEVRKKFSLDSVVIIFLPDIGGEESEVDRKIAERQTEIVELREAIEGSAMFYHAVDSRSVLLRDIIALEFDDKNGVTIFVAGNEPSGTGSVN
ncbi:hypothetical protein XW59_000660 [Aquamicrobium sp. LC103]|nr:hypothetical protein XW59_000660 [Aquamicrobium sp. LC103]